MAGHITLQQKTLIALWLSLGRSNKQWADAAKTTTRTVQRVKANLKKSGDVVPPRQKPGKKPLIDGEVTRQLLEMLIRDPDTRLSEMRTWLLVGFKIDACVSTISRLLASCSWSNKLAREIALQRSQEQDANQQAAISPRLTERSVSINESPTECGAERLSKESYHGNAFRRIQTDMVGFLEAERQVQNPQCPDTPSIARSCDVL